MYILLAYKKELLKNDYLKTLLITIIKSLKKYNNNNNNNIIIIIIHKVNMIIAVFNCMKAITAKGNLEI